MAGQEAAGGSGREAEALFQMGDQFRGQRLTPRAVVDRVREDVMTAGAIAVQEYVDGLQLRAGRHRVNKLFAFSPCFFVIPAEAMDVINGGQRRAGVGVPFG